MEGGGGGGGNAMKVEGEMVTHNIHLPCYLKAHVTQHNTFSDVHIERS